MGEEEKVWKVREGEVEETSASAEPGVAGKNNTFTCQSSCRQEHCNESPLKRVIEGEIDQRNVLLYEEFTHGTVGVRLSVGVLNLGLARPTQPNRSGSVSV